MTDHQNHDRYELGDGGRSSDEIVAEYWGWIIQALTLQAKQEPIPESLQDQVQEAVMCIAAATLVQAGMSMEVAERKFCDEDYTIKLGYDGATDEISISVVWDDGSVTEATNNAAVQA